MLEGGSTHEIIYNTLTNENHELIFIKEMGLYKVHTLGIKSCDTPYELP
jgi:hypothetical protein